MTYVPNPDDATTPTDATLAETAVAEFVALKVKLNAMLGLYSGGSYTQSLPGIYIKEAADLSTQSVAILALTASLSTYETTTNASIAALAPLNSPNLIGTPNAPTASNGTSTTQLATTAFVANTAFSSALPAQAGNAGKAIVTDGTTASWGGPFTQPSGASVIGNIAVFGNTSGTVVQDSGTSVSAITTLINTSMPAGAIMDFAMNSAPTGWAECNGQALNRTTDVRLFTAIGTTYGVGNGSTTFNVPDYRGTFRRSWDDGRGLDTGRVFGSYQVDSLVIHNHGITDPTHAHGVADPTHTHTWVDTLHNHNISDPSHGHNISDPGHSHGPAFMHIVGGGGNANANVGSNVAYDYTDASATNIGIYGATTGITINNNNQTCGYNSGSYTGIGIYGASTGITVNNSSGATETRVKNYAVLTCIKR